MIPSSPFTIRPYSRSSVTARSEEERLRRPTDRLPLLHDPARPRFAQACSSRLVTTDRSGPRAHRCATRPDWQTIVATGPNFEEEPASLFARETLRPRTRPTDHRPR